MMVMKKATLLLLVALNLEFVSAQDTPLEIPGTLFKIAPQNFIDNTLKVGAEAFSKNKKYSYTVYFSASYSYTESNQNNYYYPAGFGGEFQFRKYIAPLSLNTTRRGKEYLQGIYVGLYAQGGKYETQDSQLAFIFDPNTSVQTPVTYTKQEDITSIGGGFTIGFHRTLWKVLYFDVYLGGGLQGGDIIKTYTPDIPPEPYGFYEYYDIFDPRYHGVMPKFGLHIGVML